MYIPSSFREDRLEQLHALIETHPLGLLITHDTTGLQATPVPFMLYPDESDFGVLRAHLARANPCWKEMTAGNECLLIFQGEEGYVTPSWYPSKVETQRAVPTWNYIAVQVRGHPTVVEDTAWLRRHLDDLTLQHEGLRPEPWSVSDAPDDYVASQLKAIVGIELPIGRIEGKWKMSQNRTPADRQGVINGLQDASDPHSHRGLAELLAGRY